MKENKLGYSKLSFWNEIVSVLSCKLRTAGGARDYAGGQGLLEIYFIE